MLPGVPLRTRHRRRQQGQALVETAIVVMVVMTLFLGVYACSVAISDSQQAGGASRSGARFAAQIGANGYRSTTTTVSGCQTTPSDSCAVDAQIVNTVLGGLNNGKVSDAGGIRITVYEPCSGGSTGDSGPCPNTTGLTGGIDQCVNGTYSGGASYNLNNDYGTQYTVAADGSVSAVNSARGQYNLALRIQTHPREAAIAVQVEMDYVSPTPFVTVTAHLREFTINCLAPAS